MITIETFSNSLRFNEGIWYSSLKEIVSYPSEGNNMCFDLEAKSFWFRNRNRIIYELINKYSIHGPVFDVGGGNGYVANYLNDNGFDTVLIEPGISGCLNAKKRGLKYVINSFLDTEHFISNSIPNIGIFDVLEHLEDPDTFMETLNNLLIKDGRLFITVPAFNSLWSEEDKYAGHFRRYRRGELENNLVTHGFNIQYSTYFFSFLFLPVFFLRTIPSKIGLYKPGIQKSKNQHISHTITDKLLDIIMKIEFRKIIRRKSIKYGSSLLIVATKR